VLAYKLGQNGNYTQAKSLIDTGVNGTLFIKRQFAARLAELFDKKIEEAVDPCSATGYDEQSSQEIKRFIRLSLKLEGRVFLDQPFILLDMKHDIIVGRKFLAQQKALVDCDCRTLLWKDEVPAQCYQQELKIPRWTLADNFRMDAPEY
jgi:hypothetical protein